MQHEGKHYAERAALAWEKGAPRGRLRCAFRCYPSFRRTFNEDSEHTYCLPFWANPRFGDRHGWEGAEGWGDEALVHGPAKVRFVRRRPTPEWWASVELDAGLAQQLEVCQGHIMLDGSLPLQETEAAVVEHLCQQGKPSDVARLASNAAVDVEI